VNETTAPAAIYPRLLRRVRAIIIDEIVLLIALAAWWLALGIADVALGLKLGSLIAVFLAVDPALVAMTGGTIGHHVMGLRVRVAHANAKAGFARATLRAIVRYALGAVSLIFVLVTRRHQAIHDYVSRTVVVLADPRSVPATERFAERTGQTV
jgi:uncharacterized RDD family membrane protein YckC